jgi:hypothetical protein
MMMMNEQLFYLKTLSGDVFEAHIDGACYGWDKNGDNIDDLPQYVFELRDAILRSAK